MAVLEARRAPLSADHAALSALTVPVCRAAFAETALALVAAYTGQKLTPKGPINMQQLPLYSAIEQSQRLQGLLDAIVAIEREATELAFLPLAHAMLDVVSQPGRTGAVVGVTDQDLPALTPCSTQRVLHLSLRELPSGQLIKLPVHKLVNPARCRAGVFAFDQQALPEDFPRLKELFAGSPELAAAELAGIIKETLWRGYAFEGYEPVDP